MMMDLTPGQIGSLDQDFCAVKEILSQAVKSVAAHVAAEREDPVETWLRLVCELDLLERDKCAALFAAAILRLAALNVPPLHGEPDMDRVG